MEGHEDINPRLSWLNEEVGLQNSQPLIRIICNINVCGHLWTGTFFGARIHCKQVELYRLHYANLLHEQHPVIAHPVPDDLLVFDFVDNHHW